MVVMAESEEGLQHNLQIVRDMLSKWGLKVNWRKTKVMRVARDSKECEVKIGDEVIEQVDAMKYFGVMIRRDALELSRSTKMKVVNATVMPVLM